MDLNTARNDSILLTDKVHKALNCPDIFTEVVSFIKRLSPNFFMDDVKETSDVEDYPFDPTVRLVFVLQRFTNYCSLDILSCVFPLSLRVFASNIFWEFSISYFRVCSGFIGIAIDQRKRASLTMEYGASIYINVGTSSLWQF